MQPSTPVGIIGLGLMGTALSERLIEADVPLIGYDIDPTRREKLKATGGMVAPSVRELAGRSATIIIAVYNGEQVEALFGDLENAAGAVRPLVVCTTTCGPDEMTRLARRAASARIPFVEAPISGTSAELRDGTATALVAGETGAIESVGTLLDILCPRRVRVGAVGDASRTKLAINSILQNNRAALAEGIAFAERLGLDGRAFLAAARESAAYSRVMETKGDKMLTRDFRPQSHISQTLKDAELILEEAGRLGLLLPMTTTQAELLRAAIALEGPGSDSAAVIEAIRQRPAAPGAYPMIPTAIVGLGRWGRNLVKASLGHERLKIVRAVEPDLKAARGFCAEHHLELTDRLDAVLADGTIGAILLATPHSLHPAQVIACAAARKQVFCEKPLALCRSDAIRMFDACREAGVALAVGHNRRFWPSMRALRGIVASGELGTILHIEGHNSNENSQDVVAGWRLSPDESPGGGLTGAGLHVLDAFVSMLGPVRQVYAQLRQHEQGPPPLDTAVLTLDFINGVTGALATVRATPLYWRVHVFGTNGSAEVLDEFTMILRRSGSEPQRTTYPAIDVLRAELNAFADTIENKAPFPVPEPEVLATLSAFEAALQSMKSAIPVACHDG